MPPHTTQALRQAWPKTWKIVAHKTVGKNVSDIEKKKGYLLAPRRGSTHPDGGYTQK